MKIKNRFISAQKNCELKIWIFFNSQYLKESIPVIIRISYIFINFNNNKIRLFLLKIFAFVHFLKK
ncbi:hypothetical protein AOE57_00855 [Candidatus Riesia pediculicola]|nr:hypothetical protein AOE57_00855 [Candidatus Riesia pediculicola]